MVLLVAVGGGVGICDFGGSVGGLGVGGGVGTLDIVVSIGGIGGGFGCIGGGISGLSIGTGRRSVGRYQIGLQIDSPSVPTDGLSVRVVHPWIVPSKQELGMTSFITLGFVDTGKDPTLELIKKELARATTIRRAVRQGQTNVKALHDQPTTTDLSASFGGVASGVVNDGGNYLDAIAISSYDYEHVGAQEKINTFKNTSCIGPSHLFSPSCSYYKYKVGKDREDKLIEKLEVVVEAAEELKSKRGFIPSKKVRELYTPTVVVKRKRRSISQILSILKTKKIVTPSAPRVAEV
ncbi:hypothetical protein FXO38_13903 [Capsicum annuum]|nr:hypothetical protein FXO38_13903 [Capsicum annuum]